MFSLKKCFSYIILRGKVNSYQRNSICKAGNPSSMASGRVWMTLVCDLTLSPALNCWCASSFYRRPGFIVVSAMSCCGVHLRSLTAFHFIQGFDSHEFFGPDRAMNFFRSGPTKRAFPVRLVPDQSCEFNNSVKPVIIASMPVKSWSHQKGLFEGLNFRGTESELVGEWAR